MSTAYMGVQRTYSFEKELELESGELLSGVQASVWTAGSLNDARDNVIWVCHAFTASAEVDAWWPGMVGPGRMLDPEKYYIVCVNMLGSCYGTTGPLSTNPNSGKPYFHSFPFITIRDIMAVNAQVRQMLGITRIQLLVGGSMGGQQALEWAIQQPDLVERLLLIASNAYHSPWGIAFNETQRMAIQADHTWKEHHEEAGKAGMRAARAAALISYRNYRAYHLTQSEKDIHKADAYLAASYQQYQGEKLAQRFNAYSYWVLSKAMDSHHVGRNRQSMEAALGQVKARTLVIGIDSDHLFPVQEQHFLADHIPGAVFASIDSPYGHDGFLLEYEKITQLLYDILQ